MRTVDEILREFDPESLRRASRREPIAALNAIRERENGEPLVDIRKHCPNVIVARRCVPFLRESVADRVNVAASRLPAGFSLQARTCLRSFAMQKSLFDRYFAELSEKHPDWSHATRRRQCCRFFAPYDQKAPPGHCTGAAIDVHLLLPSGRRADMVSPLSGWKAARSDVAGLSPRAKLYRTLVFDAMLGAGFSNCGEEFWHFSHGDAGWAVRTGAHDCIYGIVAVPKSWTGRR